MPDTRRVTLEDLRSIYARHFADPCQERRMLSTAGFFTAFSTARAVTHSIRDGRGPFRNISPGGHHIHHMTFGIIGMLLTGYAWVNQVGIGNDPKRRRASRITSVAYGAGAALTLDEFALWLNLQDDYWTKQGRESIDAVAIFGSLLLMALYGRDMLAEIARVPFLSAAERRRQRARRAGRSLPRIAALARDPRRVRELVF